MAEPFRIVFILYPRLTQLDFTGPYEVLSRMPGAEVVLASKDGGSLASETGLIFGGLRCLADINRADLIMIPGGYAPAPPFNCGRPETADPATIDAVRSRFAVFAEQRRKAIESLTETA